MSFIKRKAIQNKSKKETVLKKRQQYEKSILSDGEYKTAFSIDNMKFSDEYMKIAMEHGLALVNDIYSVIRTNKAYLNMEDKDKMKFFTNNKSEFQKEFPIVSRYAICMGQFHPKAFKKYLDKCKNYKYEEFENRTKGYAEDQWVRRQADYVRYLWEEYSNHYNIKEAQGVWQHAYDTLKKEFSDFRDLHKQTEEKLKKESSVNQKELAKELLNRIKNKEQTLNDNSSNYLLNKLQTQVNMQRKSKNLIQLKEYFKQPDDKHSNNELIV
jgi:hypothetical protein